MKHNFQESLDAVLKHEGGWADHPKDPGGATMKGITLTTFQRYYGKGMSKDDLRRITDEQVAHIYKNGYWDACRCDDLPSGLDYATFDGAVHSGPHRSAKWLQEALGVSVDGRVGPITLRAANDEASALTIDEMLDLRLEFLRSLSTWDTFGRGWRNRILGVRAMAEEMEARTPADPYRQLKEFMQWVRGLDPDEFQKLLNKLS